MSSSARTTAANSASKPARISLPAADFAAQQQKLQAELGYSNSQARINAYLDVQTRAQREALLALVNVDIFV